jgi:hypothetical protein
MSASRPRSAGSAKSNRSPDGKRTPASPGMENSESAQSILESKNNRKRAEADLQLLSNRIALLRLEEAKSLQKVQETKNRAKEILE